MRITRGIVAACAAMVLPLSPIMSASAVAGTYYTVTDRYKLTDGLYYETRRLVTEQGFLDVFALFVPTEDDNIRVSPVESSVEFGLKESTTALLRENGAIAGINGDFFGMAGHYSVPLGLEMSNGNVTSAGEYSNYSKSEHATLFLGENGNPFIEYVRLTIKFLNGGKENIPVGLVNKMSTDDWPVVFTADVIKDTKDLDSRFGGLTKIVAEGGRITKISGKGETVKLPKDGFIVIIGQKDADKYIPLVHVGEEASYTVSSWVDLSKVQTAVTGAGTLLKDGKQANETGFVSAGRAPRTAIGYTEDRKTLIMAVIDGRGRSVGVNHAETAEIMLSLGAYDAMHLDGGGSSTFAVTPYGGKEPQALNTPSDGGQRAVINAVGVFMDAPVGDIIGITIKPEYSDVVVGHPVSLDIWGYDRYYHRIELDETKLAAFTTDGSGSFFGGDFYPKRNGDITIFAYYDGNDDLGARFTLHCRRLSLLNNLTDDIRLAVKGSVALKFDGTDGEGVTAPIDASMLNYDVVPPDLGTVRDGAFTAANLGQGYIRAYTGEGVDLVETYIPVSVSLVEQPIDALGGGTAVKFEAYPDKIGITGKAFYENYWGDLNGLRIDRSFVKSYDAQAAYAVFDKPLVIGDDAAALRLRVYGHTSLDWLRGRVIDANGKQYAIDFALSVDFDGWKDLDAALPESAKRPLKLERLYVAAAKSYAPTESNILLTNLRQLSAVNLGLGKIETPKGTTFADSLRVSFDGNNAASGDAYDITVMGALGSSGTSLPDYESNKARAIDAFKAGSSAGLYFGSADISAETGALTLNNKAAFRSVAANGLFNISFCTAKGGILSTDITQWGKVESALADIEGAPYVIVQTDTYIDRFKDKEEARLLHDILKRVAREGKTRIFVVSADGGAQTVSVRDGIRYINLARLHENDAVNGGFSILRIRIDGSDIKYALENLF